MERCTVSDLSIEFDLLSRELSLQVNAKVLKCFIIEIAGTIIVYFLSPFLMQGEGVIQNDQASSCLSH